MPVPFQMAQVALIAFIVQAMALKTPKDQSTSFTTYLLFSIGFTSLLGGLLLYMVETTIAFIVSSAVILVCFPLICFIDNSNFPLLVFMIILGGFGISLLSLTMLNTIYN